MDFLFDDEFVSERAAALLSLNIDKYVITADQIKSVEKILELDGNTTEQLQAKRNSVVKLLTADRDDEVAWATMSGVTSVIDMYAMEMNRTREPEKPQIEDNEIRISKKLCSRVEQTPVCPKEGWNIAMPESSQYAGYSFYVSDYWCSETATYISLENGTAIKQRWSDQRTTRIGSEPYTISEYKYELVKSEREPGKRYPRPKLTFAELKAEFAEHSEQFYSDNMPQALAFVLIYRDNGRSDAGEVIGSRLCVGGYNDTWFYPSDRERRRINSKGVKILQELQPDEIEPMKARIARYYELQTARRNYNELLDEIDRSTSGVGRFYEKVEETLPQEAALKAGIKLDEIKAIIKDSAKELTKEYEALDQYFSVLLEQKPTSRQICEQQKAEQKIQQPSKVNKRSQKGSAKTK